MDAGIGCFALVVFAAVAISVMIVLVIIVRSVRSPKAPAQYQCSSCGTSHPALAQYCRRCGKKL